MDFWGDSRFLAYKPDRQAAVLPSRGHSDLRLN